MVVKACARALRDFPRANGAYRDGHVELYSRVNVGVAVAAQDALVVPTIFDADRKSLGEIATETRALAEKVREGIALGGYLRCRGFLRIPELNVRTYVIADNKPGVWFFSLDAANPVAVAVARRWYHLPYFHASDVMP